MEQPKFRVVEHSWTDGRKTYSISHVDGAYVPAIYKGLGASDKDYLIQVCRQLNTPTPEIAETKQIYP
jgi:hypothetical protein